MEEKLNTLLILLCRSISNRKIYFSNHPKIIQYCKDFIDVLDTFLAETEEESLFIGIVEGNIVYKGRNMVGPSIIGRQLVNFADNLHCGGITFNKEVTNTEIRELLNLASDIQKPVANLQEARELLAAKGVINISIAHHFTTPSDLIPKEKQLPWQGKDNDKILNSPAMIYQALFDVVSSTHGNAAVGNSLDLDTTHSVCEYMLEHTRSNFSDMMQQIHYPDFDAYTVGHSVRVATLAVFVGNKMNFPDEKLLDLGTAGLLHDVGKSKIPEEILFKPGSLTAEEFAIIQEHPQLGVEILLAENSTTELDIAGAWGHHIRHDGKGYPKQPSWGKRHPLTALLQICDVFEALTAVRPYKPPMTPQTAFSIMLGDKGAFHPTLLANFISAIGLYPPGNNVILSDGSRGTILSVGQRIDKPMIKITHTTEGEPLEEKNFFSLDLQRGYADNISISELLIN